MRPVYVIPSKHMSIVRNIANMVLPVTLQKVVRKYLYTRRLSKYSSRTVQHRVFDQNLSIWLGDKTAERWYDRNIKKLPFWVFLEDRLLVERCLVLYVGAHYCVYANAIAKILENHGNVVAVEANLDVYNAAKRNIEINSLTNIEVIHRAISDNKGTLRFSLEHTVSSGKRGHPEIIVPAGTIDDLTISYGEPRLVIVDIEGYECSALRGAARTLRVPADWCVEVHVGCGLERFGGSLEAVLQYFPTERFTLYMARDYGIDKAEPFDRMAPLTNERFHLIAISKEFDHAPSPPKVSTG